MNSLIKFGSTHVAPVERDRSRSKFRSSRLRKPRDVTPHGFHNVSSYIIVIALFTIFIIVTSLHQKGKRTNAW